MKLVARIVDHPHVPDIDTPWAKIQLVRAIRNLGYLTHQFWKTEAATVLDSTYDRYVKALSLEFKILEAGFEVFEITLDAKEGFIYNLEFGARAYDMKKTLSKSSKTKYAKDGSSYMIIPFQESHYHKTKKGRIFSPPKSQIKKSKFVRQDVSMARLKQQIGIVSSMNIEKGRQKTWHKFLTMSSRHTGKWIHPGFVGYMIHEKVQRMFHYNIAPAVLGTAVMAILRSEK